MCLPGWARNGEFCAECPPSQSFDQWSESFRAFVVAAVVLLFASVVLLGLLLPLFPGLESIFRSQLTAISKQPRELFERTLGRRVSATSTQQSGGGGRGWGARAYRRYKKWLSYMRGVGGLLKILVVTLQLVLAVTELSRNTYQLTIAELLSSLSFLTLSAKKLPHLNCIEVRISFLALAQRFMVGVSCVVIFIGGIAWPLGVLYAKRVGLERRRVERFGSLCLSRIIFILCAWRNKNPLSNPPFSSLLPRSSFAPPLIRVTQSSHRR